MNWFGYAALFAAGYAWGRYAGRRRTRADLARLGDLITGAVDINAERAFLAELDALHAPQPEKPPHA